ncbi:sigma-70 family RNA polymerase sigma factor [Streptomyces sp. NPDC055709]
MPIDRQMTPSDMELTASMRHSESSAPVDELYRRHRNAVLSYALTCCRDPHTADDLVSEAFTRTLQAVEAGAGPEAAWRPYLLTVVRRIAASWAGTERRTDLSTEFERWLTHHPDTAEGQSVEEHMLRLEDSSLVLRAFRSLPERWQTVLWHTAVEEEPARKVGALLGISASAVTSLAARAREGLREAYLTAHVESGSYTDECRHYTSLLGAAVRRTGRRANKDLDRHLASCERCRDALIELTYLNDRLGAALPVGFLLWGGSGYVAARLAEASAGAGATAASGLAGPVPTDGGHGMWTWAKGAPIASGAVAGSVVTAVGLAVLTAPLTPGSEPDGPTPSPGLVQAEPTVTVERLPTATITSTASPSATRQTSDPVGGPTASVSRTPDGGSTTARGGSLNPVYLRSDQNLDSPESSGSVSLTSPEGRNYDGTPHKQLTFVASGVSGVYDGGSTQFDLFVDAGNYVANGPQLRISYDLTGNGTWDRIETYRYFETDAVPGYEHYTDVRGLKSATGHVGDMVNGRIRVEVWSATGSGPNTLGVGDTSLMWFPFS